MLSTIANLESFRLDGTTNLEPLEASDRVVDEEQEENEVASLVKRETAVRTNPSSQQQHPCTNNAVNRKEEIEEGLGINNNSMSSCTDSSQQPPPVKPKPPTATKPHNLPNYTSERGAGRGGPSAGGGMLPKSRAQRGEPQQQQQQSNAGGAPGAGSGAGGGGGGGGISEGR